MKIDWCKLGFHTWLYEETEDKRLSRFCKNCGRQEKQLQKRNFFRVPDVSIKKRIFGIQEREED